MCGRNLGANANEAKTTIPSTKELSYMHTAGALNLLRLPVDFTHKLLLMTGQADTPLCSVRDASDGIGRALCACVRLDSAWTASCMIATPSVIRGWGSFL